MPRTLPAGISGNYTQDGSQPGYLLRITLADGTLLRITSLDADFTLDGDLYTSMDVTVPEIQFDGTVNAGARVLFGDMDIILWTLALQRAFDDAPIEIDVVYAGAPGESVTQVYVGTCGSPQRSVDQRSGATFSISLEAKAGSQYAPRARIQDFINKVWMLAPGEILLVNGQKWVIDRPRTSNV